MDYKLRSVADIISGVVAKCIHTVTADIGVFVFSKDKFIGLAMGGKNAEFKEEVVPFLKEAIKRMQQVIEATEKKEIDISKDDAMFAFNNKEGKFQHIDKPKDENKNN